MVKLSNEITVKIKCGIDEVCDILEKQDFKVKETFVMKDHFFIPNYLDIDNMSVREILAKAVLIRDIFRQKQDKRTKKLTFKRKEIDENGVILNQDSINLDINDIDETIKFLNAIDFREVMIIEEKDILYIKGNMEIGIKDIKNGDNLIEIETFDGDDSIDTIEKLKKRIAEINIPYYTDNYFVKKAEIELSKVLGR